EVILWNGPHWYTNEEDKVPTILTQIAGAALAVQGAIVALVAALCLARALVPLTFSPAASGSAPAALCGGPVLPLCRLLFLVAGMGPRERSRRAARDYEFSQSRPGQFQDWAVELDRRLVPVGRTFAVLWFGIGGALVATPLFLKPRVWQLRRRLNRAGRKHAIGALLLSAAGILARHRTGLREAARWLRGARHAARPLRGVRYACI